MAQQFPRSASRLLTSFALVGTVALAALSGCGDQSTEPDPAGSGQIARRVAIGDTVVERVAIGRDPMPNVHSFVPQSDGLASILVDARRGSIVVAVVDSTTSSLMSRTEFRAGSSSGGISMPPFPVETNRVYTVSVWTSESDSVAFRYVPFMVDTAPETSSAAIAIGDVVGAETLDSLADVDEFTFTGGKGDEIIIYAQGLDPTDSPSRLSIRVAYTDTTKLSRYVTAAPRDPDPESHTTRTMVLPADGQYSVTVTSVMQPSFDPPPAYVGRYRIELARIDRAPEAQPATITPGDTIEGAIERVGDIDEFHLGVDAGQQFNVFFGASGSSDANALSLEAPPYTIEARGSDGRTLADNPTGTFTISAAGSYTLRVKGQSDGEGLNRGAYRLFVYRVDSLPEAGSAKTLSLGDTIADAIDLPGDVDRFPVVFPTPTLLNIELWRGASSEMYAPTFQLLDAGGHPLFQGALPPDSIASSALGTGPISVPAGSYTLQVLDEWTGKGAYRGPWRVALYQSDTLPETHSVQVALGDTVEEGSDPLGDVDHFEMSVQRGDQYQIFLQSPGVGLELVGQPSETESENPRFSLYASAPGGQTLLESAHTNRISIRQDGVYSLRVAVTGVDADPTAHEPYRFVVTRFNGEVEHHSATIAVGDTVDDEAMDFPGDLDEFTLVGAPGGEATVMFSPPSQGRSLTVQVSDLDTREVLKEMSSSGYWQATGRFLLPSSGRVGLRLLEPYVSYDDYQVDGPYSMRVMRVDRAPESVAASFSIGDIVSGESIEFSGDADEFTFSATAGDRLRAFLDVPNGAAYFGGLTLEVSPAGSDSALASVSLMNAAPELDVGTSVVTIPASGTYTVRVHGYDERQASAVDQPTSYRFQLRREP